jgi:hypothetical protein
MSDNGLSALMQAMDLAAFERLPDGAFVALTEPPAWFAGLFTDTTFPFLGHILSEATEFWTRRVTGTQEWGPCEEVDQAGRPYHYKVTAVAISGRQYLVFQLDRASDKMRELLQKVREHALADADRVRHASVLASDARKSGERLFNLIDRLRTAAPADAQADALNDVSGACSELLTRIDKLARSAQTSA